LEILKENNVQLDPDKAEWFQEEVEFLGMIVGKNGT
jgi:hypothetical protein